MKPYYADTVVVATSNKNKLRELSAVGREFNLRILSPEECRGEFQILNPPPDVEETGGTYRENAVLKAKAYVRWSGVPSLGDDSGLEVSALSFRPGLHSARYAGAGASDRDKINRILSELDELEKSGKSVERSAFFRCSLALVFPNDAALYADSVLPGRVLRECRGSQGFGYDPIIELDSLGKTLAEVDFETTVSQGFRPIAARKLFNELINLGICKD